MDKLGRLEVEQLKVTSTTPPADSGFYKIDETTMGVVGDLKFRHPKTGAMSSALTVTTTSAQGVRYLSVGDQLIQFAPRIGKSFADAVATAGADTSKPIRYRVQYDNAWGRQIECAIPQRNGEYVVHRIGREPLPTATPAGDGFIRHYDAYIATRSQSGEIVRMTSFTEAEPHAFSLSPPVMGWTSNTGQNPYTTIVGTEIAFSFFGTGFDLNYFADIRGGVWEVWIDDALYTTVSTWRATTQQGLTQVARGLSQATHSVTLKFLGADPLNAPQPGPARGWITRDASATPTGATARQYATIRVAKTYEDYAIKQQLASPSSNLEFAIRGRKNGAVVNREFWPNHATAGGNTVNGQAVYVDGKYLNLTIPFDEWIDCWTINVMQTLAGQNVNAASDALWKASCAMSLTHYGFASVLDVTAQADVDVDNAYGIMAAMPSATLLTWNNGTSQAVGAKNDTRYTSAKIADSGVLTGPHGYCWAYDIVDVMRSARVGRPAFEPAFSRIDDRSDAVGPKAYNYIASVSGGVIPAGERIVIAGRWAGGLKPSGI